MTKTFSYFLFIYLKSAAKVRISERNTKGKLVFLFISERKYLRLRSKVLINERKTKEKALFFGFS